MDSARPEAGGPTAAGSDGGGRGVAVVTGASSGIGAATAAHLARAGFSVVLGARRTGMLSEVVAGIGPAAVGRHLDVTDSASVAEFCAAVPDCRLVVNCAGGAVGLDRIADSVDERWQTMYDTNVLGTLRVTRTLLPALIASGDGHVVGVGSIAAFEPYVGGSGYNAAKAANRALLDVLRLELVGQPVRVTQVDPGMVATDFSLNRFAGDAERAAGVYAGVEALTADDIAEIITFAATRPSHVDIDNITVRPRQQARAWLLHRTTD